MPHNLLLAVALGATLLASAPAAHAQRAAAQIPTCAKPLGSIAVVEPPGTNWWSGQHLPSPSALIKVYVARSRCFTLVDRGRGLDAAKRERALGGDGELRVASNVGKGQMKAADYVLVPDLVSRNNDAGGTRVGALLGGLVGGRAGAAIGGVNLRSRTADVVLTVTDVRSSEQVAMAEGSARKTDVGWNGGGLGLLGGVLAGANVGGYANTEIGQVIATAYANAYVDLVAQLGGMPADASAANSTQAVTVAKPARLLADPAGKGGAVRSLDIGMMLYPTGNKQGGMWEVQDEFGNKGWVSTTLLEMSK